MKNDQSCTQINYPTGTLKNHSRLSLTQHNWLPQKLFGTGNKERLQAADMPEVLSHGAKYPSRCSIFLNSGVFKQICLIEV